MYHRHTITIKYVSIRGGLWIIAQPGEEDIYLHNDGHITSDFELNEKSDNTWIDLDVTFE